MGVKELWSFLTPFCERRPINALHGKVVAIDLAGWVCESLNVVDYFIHPRQYMKNLFFRTCFLLLEGITPVFVLEGKAPDLKANVIQQRNEIQFRGVKPREVNANEVEKNPNKKIKGRSRFNYVLKNCESLLNAIGIACVQAPGEAEAYCAYLNKIGLVDGIISQDSDCFAYGAVTVYRNFAVSTQGTASAQGGSVDIYDMRTVTKEIDFGQEKIIVLALFCGCDYGNGVNGVGKDSVFKFFKKYKNSEVLERIKSWRSNDSKLSELEMKVNDKNICSNCGHFGKTISHTKSGCSVCRLSKGCLETSWKEEKLILKAELQLKQKSLQDPNFPSQDIIDEFFSTPAMQANLNLTWTKPNTVGFIKNIGKLLQWTEIYCFQKFLPLVTRWQLIHADKKGSTILHLQSIVKKRIVKGNPGYEIVWKDEQNLFDGLIPNEQIEKFLLENPKGIQALWSTIEPTLMVEKAHAEIVESFLKSKEKPKKTKASRKKQNPITQQQNDSFNMSTLLEETEKISKNINQGKRKCRKGLQLIDKYFYKSNAPSTTNNVHCSTPKQKLTLFDLEKEESYEENDLSDIINNIVFKSGEHKGALLNLSRKVLFYEKLEYKNVLNGSRDDIELLPGKRVKLNNSFAPDESNSLFRSKSMENLSINNLTKYDGLFTLKESSFFGKIDHLQADEFEKSLTINFYDSDHEL